MLPYCIILICISKKEDHCEKAGNNVIKARAVGAGGAGGVIPPSPDFDRSLNPISTRGIRLCPSHYYLPPKIFRLPYGPKGLSDSGGLQP